MYVNDAILSCGDSYLLFTLAMSDSDLDATNESHILITFHQNKPILLFTKR